VDFLFDGPERANVTVALAHGAGAGADTPFMDTVAAGLADHGIRVARFEFPYMARRRIDGKRRPPDRADRLIECWHAVIAHLRAGNGAGAPAARLVVAGKSMGGRIASMIADEAGAHGLICLGYPFHPAGKPDRLRVDHLAAIQTPTLILQGERDALGDRAEVAGYALSDAIRIDWLAEGDHDFRPRKRSGHSHEGNLAAAVRAMAAFVDGLGGAPVSSR
jgi:predicted alpha/beta-hydrolase family hydrolase